MKVKILPVLLICLVMAMCCGTAVAQTTNPPIGRAEGVRQHEKVCWFVARYDYGDFDQRHDSPRIQWYCNSA